MNYLSKKNLITIFLALVLFLVSTGASYFLFSKFLPSKKALNAPPVTKTGDGKLVFDDSTPKTEECPLNGVKYSKQQRSWWENHRPLGIMIENHEEARPQSGLSAADVIYEAVAEGGITRFLSVYYCQDAGIVGPVRSARTYFMDFISEYGESPLYAHVGGANQPGPADALSQIDDYGWGGHNDLNQFSIGFPTFWRDSERLGHTVATEHTMYSSTEKLWAYAKKSRGLTNVDKDGTRWDESFSPYDFKDDAPAQERGKSQNIHMEFWDSLPDYFVDWKFDPASNLYKRTNGKKAHLDNNTKVQLSAKNLVVLFMQELSANDGYPGNIHLIYRNKGIGKAQIFIDGKKIDGTWRKDKRTAKTLLFDNKGQGVKFDRGLIWFSIMPTDGVVTVK